MIKSINILFFKFYSKRNPMFYERIKNTIIKTLESIGRFETIKFTSITHDEQLILMHQQALKQYVLI